MISTIMTNPNISQHKREQSSTLSKRSVSSSACVKKNEIKREPAEINFCGLFKPERMEKLYKNETFHKILNKASINQAVFQASFGVILTCILRPASIAILPSKKNKDDQKYAAAHSIASGLMGFAISTILLDPFTKGINKFCKNPEKYVSKGNFMLKDELAKGTTSTYFGRLTDWVPAIPKGILTVALIPPILKYVFGMEKKKAKDKNIAKQTTVDYSLLNFKSKDKALAQKVDSTQNAKANVAFTGKIPRPSALKWVDEKVAVGLGKLADTKVFENIVKVTNKSKKISDKDHGTLFAHLTVFGSTLLSAFYVGKTLTNKDLEEDKRKTLAINQGLVWVVSTALAYTFDMSVKEKFKSMLNKFEEVNKNKILEKDMANLKNGLKIAKSIITVDLVYRFIAPVIVTPLANGIGNRLRENKAAKLAQANNQKIEK